MTDKPCGAGGFSIPYPDYAPRRPDFEDVACGLTFGAEDGAGLAPFAVGAPGTFGCGLWLEKSGTAVRCFFGTESSRDHVCKQISPKEFYTSGVAASAPTTVVHSRTRHSFMRPLRT